MRQWWRLGEGGKANLGVRPPLHRLLGERYVAVEYGDLGPFEFLGSEQGRHDVNLERSGQSRPARGGPKEKIQAVDTEVELCSCQTRVAFAASPTTATERGKLSAARLNTSSSACQAASLRVGQRLPRRAKPIARPPWPAPAFTNDP